MPALHVGSIESTGKPRGSEGGLTFKTRETLDLSVARGQGEGLCNSPTSEEPGKS
jgi:hypothetical protein